ncbi:hypothetical protein ACU4GD_12760 [Cupriavidus basilensis]
MRFEVEKSTESGEKRRTAMAIKPPGPRHRGKLADAKSSPAHNRVVNIRPSHLLISPILLCASLAGAAEPAVGATPDSGCENLLTVVRRSLEDEIGSACPALVPGPGTACAAQREPLRAIVDFIGKRHDADADACETLLEVNKRLRSLPPKG